MPTDRSGATPASTLIAPSIPGYSFTSTKDILGPNSKLCQMIWAPGGTGKTNLCASLDALTQKYEGKRTLYIPVEEGEGGGAATIRKYDIPKHEPRDWNDLYKLAGALRNDKTIGGVVLDSTTEAFKKLGKKATMAYPCRENTPTRAAGVMTRSDYQVAGELVSQLLRAFIALSTNEKPEYRKHVVITAADSYKEEDDRLVWVGPDLPGRMGREAVQLFQQVGTIYVKSVVVDGKRVAQRMLSYSTDGVKALKDRYDIYPAEILLRKDASSPGEDLLTMFEKYWLPNVQEAQ